MDRLKDSTLRALETVINNAGGRIVVTLTFVAGFFMVFYKDRLFIKTKSLDYASKMMEVLE